MEILGKRNQRKNGIIDEGVKVLLEETLDLTIEELDDMYPPIDFLGRYIRSGIRPNLIQWRLNQKKKQSKTPVADQAPWFKRYTAKRSALFKDKLPRPKKVFKEEDHEEEKVQQHPLRNPLLSDMIQGTAPIPIYDAKAFDDLLEGKKILGMENIETDDEGKRVAAREMEIDLEEMVNKYVGEKSALQDKVITKQIELLHSSQANELVLVRAQLDQIQKEKEALQNVVTNLCIFNSDLSRKIISLETKLSQCKCLNSSHLDQLSLDDNSVLNHPLSAGGLTSISQKIPMNMFQKRTAEEIASQTRKTKSEVDAAIGKSICDMMVVPRAEKPWGINL